MVCNKHYFTIFYKKYKEVNIMFPCDCCGCCCKNLSKTKEHMKLDRGDGVCRYLQNNLCSIYEHRPLACRIDENYELFYSDKMTLEEYYRLGIEVCKKLKEECQQ